MLWKISLWSAGGRRRLTMKISMKVQQRIILLQFIFMSNTTHLVVDSPLNWRRSYIQFWGLRQWYLRRWNIRLSFGIWDWGGSCLIMLGQRGEVISLKKNFTNTWWRKWFLLLIIWVYLQSHLWIYQHYLKWRNSELSRIWLRNCRRIQRTSWQSSRTNPMQK